MDKEREKERKRRVTEMRADWPALWVEGGTPLGRETNPAEERQGAKRGGLHGRNSTWPSSGRSVEGQHEGPTGVGCSSIRLGDESARNVSTESHSIPLSQVVKLNFVKFQCL